MALPVAVLASFASAGPVHSATATGTMNVRVTIQAECTVVSAADLDFGTQGVLSADIDQTTTINVQCTDGTPYNVGLNAGTGAGASVTTRYMTGPGSAVVAYGLYRDAAHALVWGDTVSSDTVGGTGNGSSQALTVYGNVPPQTTPAAGAYADLVTITITY
nr:spore coat U domain-containing protein [Nitratireductor pacificus]